MLDISIKTVSHDKQRYPTVGDYWREKHRMHFRISEMGNKAYEFLVAIHELVEQFLLEYFHITMESVDKFDIEYEKAREQKVEAPCGCKLTETSEPGDDKHAPYYKQHQIATAVERVISAFIPGFDWNDYDKTVNEL